MTENIEKKWQERWDRSDVFVPEQDDSRPKFLITVPWPYTNGSLHVGHGRTYTLADIIARFKRTQGYNVLFPMAFHQSGTPILAFSERLARGDPTTIKQYQDYLKEYEKPEDIPEKIKEFRDPKAIASYFSQKIIEDFKSLGYGIDWTRVFTSADPEYQDFVKWQFLKLNDLGLIRQGSYPVLYSMDDDNAVGEDDIKDGDIDKVTVEEFTAIFFRGKDFSLVAASLRPETIFGITNLWISVSGKYVLCNMKGEDIAITEEAYKKLIYQVEDLQLKRNLSHDEILSLKFRSPLSNLDLNVIEADFVDPDNGTGVVYSVPGHSVWDFIARHDMGMDLNTVAVIETDSGKTDIRSIISSYDIHDQKDSDKIKEATQVLYREEFYRGRMSENNGIYSGKTVREARDLIKSDLIAADEAFILYETSRKAETRSGSKVTVAVLRDQWFIDYGVEWWKEKSRKVTDNMTFYPEFYRRNMLDAIDWLRERPCARRRGLGTKLPMDNRWVIESLSDSTIYPEVYTNINQLKKIKARLETVDTQVMDYIYGYSTQIPDGIPDDIKDTIKDARKARDYWYGVDLRLTAYPHMSNHLAFYVMNHAALFTGKDLPGGLVVSSLVVSNGSKISKSKGNVISLLSISRKYSADIYRLYVAVSADIGSTMDWNENDLSSVIKKYENFVEAMENFHPANPTGSRSEKWFKARFRKNINSFISSMEAYNLRNAAITIFYDVMNDLKYAETRGGNRDSLIGIILREWLVSMSVFIPHTCEEYWHRYVEDSFVSMARLQKSGIEGWEDSIIAQEEYLQEIIRDIREISRATGITPRNVTISVAGKRLVGMVRKINREGTRDLDTWEKQFVPEFMKNRKRISERVDDEFAFLDENRKYISEALGCSVNILVDEPGKSKKTAWPGRPSIILD
ncbi:MAG: leucine--tRNA ligase [Thermoplasmataceae archaeon]